MSFLLGSLSSAARALEAQSYGLEVTGQNIANINTPGYARRTVNFAEVPPADPLKAGGGVVATGVTAYRAHYDRQLPGGRCSGQWADLS